jgi:ATP-dependent 26S proteasome regulatory subunit
MAKSKKKPYPPCEADKELKHMIMAKYSIIYVLTWEERRVVDSLESICSLPEVSLGEVLVWNSACGLRTSSGCAVAGADDLYNPEEMLSYIQTQAENEVREVKTNAGTPRQRGPIFVLHDLFRYFEAKEFKPEMERLIKNISQLLKMTSISIVITSPELVIPLCLDKLVSVLDYPLPGPEQLKAFVQSGIKFMIESKCLSSEAASAAIVDDVVRACQGLTLQETEDAISRAVIKTGKLDISSILDIKKQIIRKGKVLDYAHSTETLDNVGGLDGLKEWIRIRKSAFGEEARKYGLPPPKGVFVLGVQGTGKSLFAKAVANELQQPLLKLDIGRCLSQYIGESENNIRQALKLAESIAPCVLFIDELDMAMSGATDSGGDNGVSKRIVATVLDWMQERAQPVFVVAAANSTRGLPPAILRRGRFDDMFFVDLPSQEEREEIFKIHIRKAPRNRDPKNFDIQHLARQTDGYSGAEIESVIIDAMNAAFADNKREFTTRDILDAIGTCKPLSTILSREIDALRLENKERMRPASKSQQSAIYEEGSRFKNMNSAPAE